MAEAAQRKQQRAVQRVFSHLERRDVRAVARALMSGGVDVSDKDDEGCTLLHRAASMGLAGLCEGLVRDFGADANCPTVGGDTPMHLAAAGSHKGVMKLLERLGADPLAHNAAGFTPLDLRRDV